ncbi:MAG: hypothetical protein U9O86_07685 [Campylobacterota bacterium]|nr:hypothetical protein [Campylobacterota bacterium]
MKKKILTLLSILALSSSLAAQQGEFISLDKETFSDVSSGKFKVGAMVDTDYGFGASGQLGHIIDIKLGLEGVGADLHIWKMDFKDNSTFLKERPLEFYISAGMGYRWSTFGQDEGFVVRTPIGADWQFSKQGWSAYLEVGPSYNFSTDTNNRNGLSFMSGTGIRYNF